MIDICTSNILYYMALFDIKIFLERCDNDPCLNGGTCNAFDGTCICRNGCYGSKCEMCIAGM